MCNVLSNQKTAFACKGLCANCWRMSASKDERPGRRIESAINNSEAGPSNNTAIAVKIDFQPLFTQTANW